MNSSEIMAMRLINNSPKLKKWIMNTHICDCGGVSVNGVFCHKCVKSVKLPVINFKKCTNCGGDVQRQEWDLCNHCFCTANGSLRNE